MTIYVHCVRVWVCAAEQTWSLGSAISSGFVVGPSLEVLPASRPHTVLGATKESTGEFCKDSGMVRVASKQAYVSLLGTFHLAGEEQESCSRDVCVCDGGQGMHDEMIDGFVVMWRAVEGEAYKLASNHIYVGPKDSISSVRAPMR
eukprot:223414-Pelagomonas_calceolata.AAC.1